MPRPRPNLPRLNIPHQGFVEQWLDHFDDSDSIDEHPEYSLNLGAESPASVDDTIPTPPPSRVFQQRRSTYPQHQQQQRKRNVVDRDCGICFEYAVQPSRTLCCGKIFCLEHIRHWLHGPSSDGRCPSCSAPCSLSNTLSLASPTLRSKNPPVPASQDPGPNNSLHTSRTRSQSTSTTSTQQSLNSTTSSLDSSILGLSPTLEEPSNAYEEEDESHWLVSYVRALSRSTSRSSLTQRQSSPFQPHAETDSSITEVLSRLTSLMGLTLLFYVLFAS